MRLLALCLVSTAMLAQIPDSIPPSGGVGDSFYSQTGQSYSIPDQSSFTYYVSQSTGSDTNPGTKSQPFQTISKVNGLTLSAGQSVGFKRGDIWRGTTLTIPNSGSSGSPITFAAYGTGATPIIDAGQLLSGWAQGAGASAQESCTGSCLFASGFETAAFGDWTSTTHGGTTAIAIDSSVKAHGASSMTITGDGTHGAYAVKTITALTSGSTYYFRSYVYTPSGALPASSSFDAMWFATASSPLAFIQLKTNAGSVVNAATVNTGANVCSSASIPNWTMNGWNVIDWTIQPNSTTTAGSTQVLVNGVSVCNVSSVNTSGAVSATQAIVGDFNGWKSGAVLHFDDVKFASADPGVWGGGAPTTTWSTAQASSPLLPFNTQTDAALAYDVDSAFPNGGGYYWNGTTLYVNSPSGSPATFVEIPNLNNAAVAAQAYLNISNIDFRGAAQQGLKMVGDITGVTLNGITVEMNYEEGLYLSEFPGPFSTTGTIQNSIFQYNGASGFRFDAVGAGEPIAWAISGNTFSYNDQIGTTNSGSFQFDAGMKLTCDNATNGTGTVISGNTANNNGPLIGAFYATQSNGIWVDTCTGVTVTQNVVHDNGDVGIYLEADQSTTATYNVSYNNAAVYPLASESTGNFLAGNILLLNDTTLGVSGNLIANNTSYGGQQGVVCADTSTGHGAIVTSNVFKNNIATGATLQDFYVGFGCDNDTNGSGNVYLTGAYGVAATGFAYWQSTGSISTYSALDTAYGSAMSNVQSDPQFVNAATGNFNLQSGSPAINVGTCITGTTPCPTNIGAK